MIITAPDGHVHAVEGDFSQDRPAGYTVAEMQERRATDAAWRKVVRASCSEALAAAILSGDTGATLRNVALNLTRAGWRVTAKSMETAEKQPEKDD